MQGRNTGHVGQQSSRVGPTASAIALLSLLMALAGGAVYALAGAGLL